MAFDYYNKKTKDWLVQAPVPLIYGTGAPYINGGDIENKGFEVALNWNDMIRDFNYGINFNLAYNKNEVTRIANTEGIIHGPSDVLTMVLLRFIVHKLDILLAISGDTRLQVFFRMKSR